MHPGSICIAAAGDGGRQRAVLPERHWHLHVACGGVPVVCVRVLLRVLELLLLVLLGLLQVLGVLQHLPLLLLELLLLLRRRQLLALRLSRQLRLLLRPM